jgi:nucleoside-diphosphate-sugar epimerase
LSAVLVTGGTGLVGKALVEELDRTGAVVRVLVRRDMPVGFFPIRVEAMRGDMRNPESLQRASQGVHVICHLAARMHGSTSMPQEVQATHEVNVGGTNTLLRAARENGVSRFVFFSTISVYGPSEPGQVHDEASRLQPESVYAETKVAAEDAVRSSGVPSVVLRLAAVYGPGMKGNYPRLVEALRRRRFPLIGDGSNRRTLVYLLDAVRAAVLASEHPAALGRTFNVTDGTVHTLREILDAICLALGRGPVRMRVPASPTLGVARLVEAVASRFGRSLRLADAARKLLEDIAVSGERARRELGFRPETDLVSGWKRAVEAGPQHTRSTPGRSR